MPSSPAQQPIELAFQVWDKVIPKNHFIAALYEELQADALPRPGLLMLARMAERFYEESNQVVDRRLQEHALDHAQTHALKLLQTHPDLAANARDTLTQQLDATLASRYADYKQWRVVGNKAPSVAPAHDTLGHIRQRLVQMKMLQPDGETLLASVKAKIAGLDTIIDKTASKLELEAVYEQTLHSSKATAQMNTLSELAASVASHVPYNPCMRGKC